MVSKLDHFCRAFSEANLWGFKRFPKSGKPNRKDSEVNFLSLKKMVKRKNVEKELPCEEVWTETIFFEQYFFNDGFVV